MASAISKRQQARNERMLQDLLRTVPGNDRCADCAAKNPTWASWNLGMFLCERCGGLHRKLGTHVSKVKSLSMDSWSGEQVEHMKKVGNAEGNQRWNPRGVRPDIPIDVDEVDGAIERFIRQKYEQRAFVQGGMGPPASARAPVRQNTGSTETGSWSEEPPPLPPKPGKRFGFSLRSASSTLPKASKHDRNFTPPLSPTFSGNGNDRFNPPSPRNIKAGNKPSQMFGMKIMGVGNNFDAKLATLRDMGFGDARRNSEVLKGANGNLDTAIETLVRQGEGSKPATPGPRTLTPVSMASQGAAGITFEKTRQPEKKANSNPWEIREEVPQRAATQPVPEPPRSQSAQPQASSWNPFLAQTQPVQPPQQQQQLVDSFQNLQMSQTGPAQQQQYVQRAMYGQQGQNNPFQPAQPSNPWETANMSQQMPQHSATDPTYGQQYQQAQQYQQPAQPLQPQQTSNPFLRRATSQNFVPSNPWGASPVQQQQQQAVPVQQSSNPFGLPPIPQQQQQQQVQNVLQQPAMQSPAPMYGGQEYFGGGQQGQPQAQMQQQPQQSTWQNQQGQPQQQTGGNPFYQQPQHQHQHQQMMMPQQTGMPQQQYLPQQQQQQPAQAPQAEQPWTYHEVNPQPQPRMQMDKSSILGLYNMQSSLPQQHQQQQQQLPLQSISENGGMQTQQQQYQPQQSFSQQQSQPQQQPQRSVTMPVTLQQTHGGGNPFGAFGQQQPQQAPQAFPSGPRHVSNESAAFVGLGGGDGRTSPDAFRNLSSMYAR